MSTKKPVRVGLVGAGFMGRCHANAFRTVGGLFDLSVEPVRAVLADVTEDAANRNAAALGFERGVGDWHALCADPSIDLVAITAPNVLHEPIALAALAAGKDVYCEKPLSTTVQSALRMTEAAEKAGAVTMVGFNYLRNPMVRLARDIIRAGEIGEIVAFRGRHAENYMVSPDAPHNFRTDPQGGGALADIGSHIIAMARFLVGPLRSVSAHGETVHKTRPIAPGSAERKPVVTDDITNAILAFDNGATGVLEASWVAVGRTMDLSWEITGSKGAILFTQERMNELMVYMPGAKAGRDGFQRIESGPAHPPFGNFCPAPGHHLGFNDLKVIEVADLLSAVATRGRCSPDFREASEVQRTIEAMQASSRERAWVEVEAVG
jgi:predicted dehydrogenase